MKRTCLALLVLLLAPGLAIAEAAGPLLLQKPTLSATHVAFAFADDVWLVPRAGGPARRLTSGGKNTTPVFSPDGKHLAFTGTHDGNADVYVVPASGGVARRLTFHPGPDVVAGWAPDGKSVLFRSTRNLSVRAMASGQLFTVPLAGGMPEPLPLPLADHGTFSPDGKRLAYVPFRLPERMAWKRYAGGTTSRIWLADLADSRIEKVPRDNSNDSHPAWVGDRVYFLSDRAGPVTLFAYDLKTKKVRKLLDNKGPDLKSASAGPGALVYEQFGSLHLFDLKTEKAKRIDVRIDADLPGLRPRFVKAARHVQNAGLSPTGARAVFEARGEILTVPVKKGDVRNLTRTPGVAERGPAWSPDGKWVAYFSDASGEYELHLRLQSGLGETKKYSLGNSPSFPYSPTWSPDGKKIAYTDADVNLHALDLATGKSTRIATNTYNARTLDPAWSPDSKWVAYTKNLKNHFNAVFLYSVEKGTSRPVTDGMSDARYPAFDASGKYLYFTASTDAGPAAGGIEMSNYNYPVTRSVYAVVLDKDLPSPLAPESDEEKAVEGKTDEGPAKEKGKGKAKKAVPVRIDLEDLDQRTLALPIPARHYVGLRVGKAGIVFLLEDPPAPLATRTPGPRLALHRFDLEKRKVEKFLDAIGSATLSRDGEKLLYQQKDRWFVVGTAAPPKAGEGALNLDAAVVRIDPRAEWEQMYREVWRIERDFLYDPGHHGLDLKAAEKKYRPYLAGVGSRSDLNYLFAEMLGELSLGHVYVMGGGEPSGPPAARSGLLGADYQADKGRHRFARVYRGESWSPSLRAPLTGPGVSVKEGEYLLAVNGQEVRASDNVHRFLEGTAGKSVTLRVGPSADGKGARDVTVVPIDDEQPLRNRAWIEDNRRKVERMTKGRVAYVYLPNTALDGYTNFNRYFFAQVDKEAVIIDERFNGGGKAADYVIERLGRPLSNHWSTRVGADYSTPAGAIFGPKVMIANEQAGSGGDYLPWAFKRAKLGPVVGTRTWGGLVGIGGYPSLLDGGAVTAPHFAFWTPEGEWEVENRGVSPDVEVEQDPQLVRAGRDPQLEKAVELVLAALAKGTPGRPKRPAYPNYHPRKGEAAPKREEGGRPGALPARKVVPGENRGRPGEE